MASYIKQEFVDAEQAFKEIEKKREKKVKYKVRIERKVQKKLFKIQEPYYSNIKNAILQLGNDPPPQG